MTSIHAKDTTTPTSSPFSPTASENHKIEVRIMPTITDRFLRKIGLLSAPSQTQQDLKGNNDLPPPRYPPIDFGLPVCTPEILLERNQDIVDALKQSISDQHLFDEHYFPAMLRLANMVQLLPASEAHHHRKMGGLLRHSLEVGLWAVQLAEEKIAQDVLISQRESITESRWKLAVFIAGIGHDLGKVVTDTSVTDRSKEMKWNPLTGGLYDWATHNSVENYLLHWQENRGKKHITVSSSLIDRVMQKDSKNWLSEEGPDEVCWIHESLNNNLGMTNTIHQFVVAADQLSVRQDIKFLGRRELEAENYPDALQRIGSTSEKPPTFTSRQPEVSQSNPSATLAKGLRKVGYSDVLQHNSSTPDKSLHQADSQLNSCAGSVQENKKNIPLKTA